MPVTVSKKNFLNKREDNNPLLSIAIILAGAWNSVNVVFVTNAQGSCTVSNIQNYWVQGSNETGKWKRISWSVKLLTHGGDERSNSSERCNNILYSFIFKRTLGWPRPELWTIAKGHYEHNKFLYKMVQDQYESTEIIKILECLKMRNRFLQHLQ